MPVPGRALKKSERPAETSAGFFVSGMIWPRGFQARTYPVVVRLMI